MTIADMKNTVTLHIKSNPKYLKEIRAKLASLLERAGFEKERREQIILAIDEACTNVIKHAYMHDYSKDIVIEFADLEDRIEVLIKDKGEKTDLNKVKSRPLHEIRPGGLGVHFIREIMDKVEFDTSPPEGTHLLLVKYKAIKKE